MNGALPRLARLAGLAVVLVAAVIGLTWLLGWMVPAPFSGYLAVIIVGLVTTEVVKRQPRQRAIRLLHAYLYARERGADERGARERLLARVSRDPAERAHAARIIETAWTGESEKDRVLGGVGALLARQRTAIATEVLAAAYDRVRNRFAIPGWDALPREFVGEVRRRLEAPEVDALDTLAARYQLFQQRFFRQPTFLGVDPAASAVDLARLLSSLGNRLAQDEPGDAERAYRLSLRLRPDENLAHAGLALLLERTGRSRDAVQEAKAALSVLDAYATRAGERVPTTEDISPFSSPTKLRDALEQLAAGG